MSVYICGNCMFAENHMNSSDIIYCWLLKRILKVNDYPCARFKSVKKGMEDEAK